MMRAVVITVIIVLVLFLVGWLRFSNPGGNPTLQLDTDEVKEDSGEIVEQGKAAVERVQAEIDGEGDKGTRRDPPSGDADPPAEPVEQ